MISWPSFPKDKGRELQDVPTCWVAESATAPWRGARTVKNEGPSLGEPRERATCSSGRQCQSQCSGQCSRQTLEFDDLSSRQDCVTSMSLSFPTCQMELLIILNSVD